MLDSGSTINVISEQCANAMRRKRYKLKLPLLVRVDNGSNVEVTDYVTMRYSFPAAHSRVHKLTCRVLPGYTGHILLGIMWFKTYNPQFDWQGGTMRIFGATVHVRLPDLNRSVNVVCGDSDPTSEYDKDGMSLRDNCNTSMLLHM